MSYPKNAASPERVDIGPVVQISDGAIQTSGVAVKVIPFGQSEASGGGTIAYSADGVVLYTPTQAETNYTSFILVASKSGCIPASKTVVTEATSTAGKVAVASIDTDAITAAAVKADAVTKIQAGLSTYSGGDTSGTTTLLSRLTPTRAGLLDNLSNLDASISSLNNLSALANLYASPLMEIPDSGATLFAFTLVTRDNEGKLKDLDASPTITAANAAGTDRSSNLSSVSHPGTGRYTWTYSVSNAAAEESLRVTCSGAISSEARYVEWIGAVVNYDTLTILAATKANTDTLISALPTSGHIAGSADANGYAVLDTAPDSPGVTTLLSRLTSGRAGNLDNLDVAVSVLQSQITALNNLSAKSNWFGSLLLEVPDSGTRAYVFELVVKDDEDKMVNLDALPTIALVNSAGTDRSSLITTGIANPSTGRYTLTITVWIGTVNETLKLTASGLVSGEARYAVIAPQVVDYDNATQIALLLTRVGIPAISVSADIAAVSTKVGSPAGASVSADIASIKTDTGTTIPGLLTTLTTKIRKFFQLSLRKDAAIATDNATELTELNANGGSGGGGYFSTTDSQEAIRDAGTGGGGGPGDGAAVIVDGFSVDGRAQLLSAMTAAQDDGTLDVSTCIPVISGSDWRIDFADLGDLSGRSNLIFAMKNKSTDLDTDAVVLVDKNGLLRVNGAAPVSAAHAAITVSDQVAGTGHILVKAVANNSTPAGQKYAGLKVVNSSGEVLVSEIWRPCITVLNGVVDAVS